MGIALADLIEVFAGRDHGRLRRRDRRAGVAVHQQVSFFFGEMIDVEFRVWSRGVGVLAFGGIAELLGQVLGRLQLRFMAVSIELFAAGVGLWFGGDQ